MTGRPIDVRELDHRRTLAEDCLGRLNTSLSPTLEQDLGELDPAVALDDLPAMLRADADEAMPELEEALGRNLAPEYEISIVDERAYWAYWVDTDDDGNFRMRFNRWHGAALTRSRTRLYAWHEILGHFGQIQAYREQVTAGRLPLGYGITTLHTGEQFALEGVAQTLPLWLRDPSSLDELTLARVRLAHYAELVRHNAHIRINTGDSEEQCVEYVTERLPHLPIEKVKVDLAARAMWPHLRSYQLSYGASFDAMTRAIERLGAHGRRIVLRRLYEVPLSFEEFHAAVDAQLTASG